MSYQIGIGISIDSIRAIAVRGGRVLWAAEAPFDAGTSCDAALGDLLADVRLARWPRPIVTVAVGPGLAQTKRLAGLPPLSDAGAIAQLVQNGTRRFFLQNGTPLVTTVVRVDRPGEAWAAAIERPLVDDVEAACRARGLRLRAIVPTVAVLSGAVEDDHIVWDDGDVRAEVRLADRQLMQVRHLPARASTAPAASASAVRVVEPLAALGEGAFQFSDAYGAAVLAGDEKLAIRPGRERRGADSVPRWRVLMAGAACGAMVIAAIAAPAITSHRLAVGAAARLATLAPAYSKATSAEGDLRRVTEALDEVAAFDVKRRSMTLLLGELAQTLPKSAFIVMLRADSTGGNLVVLATRAAEVLSRLERVTDIAGPEIVGPVTKEVVGGEERERVAVRFRWTVPRSSAPTSASAPRNIARNAP